MPPRPKKQQVPRKSSFDIKKDDQQAGLLQLRFDRVICRRSRRSYPYTFSAEEPTKYDLEDPGFTDEFEPVAMALVEHLIRDGYTGVRFVIIASSHVIKVVYDPDRVPPDTLKFVVRETVDYTDKNGWRPISLRDL